MTNFSNMSLQEFAAHIGKLELMHKNGEATRHALEIAARTLRGEAKNIIGHTHQEWKELADSTKERRSKLGFKPDEPLLMTGKLQNSIEFQVSQHEQKAVVGSNEDEAVWQELGTNRIPARSFLGRAAFKSGKKIAMTLGKHVAYSLAGKNIPSKDLHVDFIDKKD